MTTSPAERVLACPTLPTLPGVAMRVLELTGKPNVSITEIAEAVQNDPALSTKVLRTVNSSYYGLATPCPSISRAMGLLGLNAVKAIVLGFSLVDFDHDLDDLDMTPFWRRAVYAAAGARAFASKVGGLDPEEAFLGALVQDVGILACVAALKGEYARVLSTAPEDHDALPAHELRALGFHHAQIGRSLAERWRLPAPLVECIARHHAAEDAPPPHQALVRMVALGTAAAGALTESDPKRKLARLLTSADRWFGIPRDETKRLLAETARGARELAKVLDLSTGSPPDVASILSQAHEQLVAAQEQMQREAAELRVSNTQLTRQSITDALTGAHNRAHFDTRCEDLFARAAASNAPLALLFIDADRFKSVNDTYGHRAGDAVLTEIARRLIASIGKAGEVFRYGGEEFAVLLPGATGAKALKIADLLRQAVERKPIPLGGASPTREDLSITISIGVAALEPGTAARITSPAHLVQAADGGMYAAKSAGRNRCCASDPNAPGACVLPAGADTEPPGSQGRRADAKTPILVVEDDPLACRLLVALLAKRGTLQPVMMKSAEEAMDYVARPSRDRPAPHAVVCDVNLPGMSGVDLVRHLRQRLGKGLAVVMVSVHNDEGTRNSASQAGADLFIDKTDLCTNFDVWLDRLTDLACRARAA